MTTTSPSSGSTRISQFGAATALSGSDVFPITQGSATHKASMTQVAAFVLGALPAVSVENYGGSTALGDNSAAVQLAINYLITKGGGTLNFGPGTYLMACPNSTTYDGAGTIYYSALMASGIKFQGNGTTIKMANNVTTSGAPIATALFFKNTALSNITFRDIIFDMNGANNSVNSTNIPQSAIAFSSDGAFCNDLLIDACQFLNGVGVAYIQLSQTNTVNQAVGFRNIIRNCRFFSTNSYLTVTDHSSITGAANDTLVFGNTFQFSAIRADNIGVACDVQGTNYRFTSNLVENYFVGAQVGGEYVTPTSDVVISDNSMNPIRGNAINFQREVSTEKAVNNIIISNNDIELDDSSTSIAWKTGVNLLTTYALSNVFIFNNSIRKTGTTKEGIGVYGGPNLAGQTLTNVVIQGNVFDGLWEGVYLTAVTSNIGTAKVENNTFRNMNLMAAQMSSFGAQFYVGATQTFNEAICRNNVFINDASVTYTNGAWFGSGGGTFKTIYSDGNFYKGITTNYVESSITAATTTRYGIDALTRSAIPSGGTDGTYAVGQRVINSVPASGQFKAATCSVAGNPGTWLTEGNFA